MPLTKVLGSVWDADENDLWINVKDYGATGDGVTDDTVAFENAMAEVGKRLYVPNGTYLIDQVDVPSNVYVDHSPNAILKLDSGSTSKVMYNCPSTSSNITIVGGQFDPNEVDGSVAIQFAGSNCKALECRHLGGTGAQIYFSINGSASGIEIGHCVGDASRFFVLTGGTTSTTSDVWVHDCYATNMTGDFVEINCPSGTARRWTVSNNIVHNVGRDNNGTGFGVGASGGTGYIDGLIISNNHFRDVDNQSIHIEDGAKNVQIIGNSIYGNGTGSTGTITEPSAIYVAATVASNRQISNVIISGNNIVGLGDMKSGILFGGSYAITNCIVSDNNIENFDTYGISLSSQNATVKVADNSCRLGTGSASGLRLIGTNVLVTNNSFSDNAGYGIDVSGTPVNGQLVKNQLKGNTTGRVNGMSTGTDMDWSLQSEAVSTNRTISGTVNDLDPLDEEIIVVTTANTTPQLTGILGKPNGLIYIYNNTGAASFDIMHEDVGSSAANRFVTTDSSDITLAIGKVAAFKYIGSRWHQIQ